MRITPDNVESWANICTQDGLEEADIDLLRNRLGAIAKQLPDTFLSNRRTELVSLLAQMTEEDQSSGQAAIALTHLLRSPLFSVAGEHSGRILREIINRFRYEDRRYRNLLDGVAEWNEIVLAQFLELAEDFILECTEW